MTHDDPRIPAPLGRGDVKSDPLKSPYPYFGAKSKVAAEIWRRLGNVKNVVEPFFGSGAVLLGRPEPFSGTETVNDLDGLLCVAPETMILTADLRWRAAGEIKVGDKVLGFDETDRNADV